MTDPMLLDIFQNRHGRKERKDDVYVEQNESEEMVDCDKYSQILEMSKRLWSQGTAQSSAGQELMKTRAAYEYGQPTVQRPILGFAR